MAYREIHYRWEYDLKSDPEHLWPFVADTNRFNRDTGVPAVESLPSKKQRLRNARRKLHLSIYGFPVEWEEQPFEWIRPQRFGVVRNYTKGPVSQLRALAELTRKHLGLEPASAARPRDLETRFRFSRFCHKELARERETTGKQASGVNPVTETTEKAAPNRTLYIVLGLVLAVAIAAGVYYWRGGFAQSGATVADKDKVDPDVAVLMEPGPLPDIVIGSASAPNTIVEYASMTCPHCAQFETVVFPELKTKYIDTGKVRFIFREFPLDGLAARASLLARCAGPDRYFPMIEALFQTQQNWVVQGPEAMEKLLQFARQAGFSKESFDKCMADKELFNKIVEIRTTGYEKFGIDSTPSFFINGKRMSGEHELKGVPGDWQLLAVADDDQWAALGQVTTWQGAAYIAVVADAYSRLCLG